MPALPMTWINVLFQRFERFYGQDFVRKWGNGDIEATKQEWAEKLFQFDREVLRLAVEHCSENVSKPPSLPEFVTICKNMKPAREHVNYLPAPTFEKTEFGMQMLADLKKLIAKKRII